MNQNIILNLSNIIDALESGPVLVFLKGFPIKYVGEVMKKYRPLNVDVQNTEQIHLIEAITQIKTLYRNLMLAEDGIFIGVYEELLLVKDSIRDIYDGEIIVINNNLYESLYPVDYDEHTISKLRNMADSIQHEKMDDNDGYQLYDIVSDYIELGTEKFVSFYDLPEKVLAHIIPLVKIGSQPPIIEIEELPAEVTPLSYHIDKKEDYLSFALAVEQGGIPAGVVPLTVEYSPSKLEKLALKIFVWQEIFPEWEIQLYYISRIKDIPIRNEFFQLLKLYWQADNFREIEFYENPDNSADKILVTQGTIIEAIVKQVEAAEDGLEYQDVFVTAPTGAGKSLLFQIPAIYLAQNKSLLTLVISPLKALMLDQVRQLQEKGVEGVAYINSDLSHVQKQSIIEQVQEGRVSILYLSPELLLAYDIRSLIGDERKIGLVVVDEAHLVTTWGRDFRIDYWYLGTYLKKLRINKYDNRQNQFVIAAFTATAVYGGNDDMVFETIDSLNMNRNPLKYLGNTRRKNISFYIETWRAQQSYTSERFDITKFRICDFVKSGKKTIVYAPYRRHIIMEP